LHRWQDIIGQLSTKHEEMVYPIGLSFKCLLLLNPLQGIHHDHDIIRFARLYLCVPSWVLAIAT
jgi:hypothetical protein